MVTAGTPSRHRRAMDLAISRPSPDGAKPQPFLYAPYFPPPEKRCYHRRKWVWLRTKGLFAPTGVGPWTTNGVLAGA